jgi:hypothetical protein
VAFRGIASNRYKRGITSSRSTATTSCRRRERRDRTPPRNAEIPEARRGFSPDSMDRVLSADDMTRSARRRPLRAVADKGGQWKKLGSAFDGDVTVGFWSQDGKTITNEGVARRIGDGTR